MSRWILYDPDFYDEIVPLCDELVDNEEEERVITCRCYGRGKKLSEVEVPRVPQLHFRTEKERYIEKIRLDENPKAKRRGRGRAKVHQLLTDNMMSTVGQPQVSVPSIAPFITNAVPPNIGPPTNTGGFGRPSSSSNHHSHNGYENMEFSNIQPSRRGFSIEDFISESSTKKKKKNNRSAAMCTNPLPNSVEETEESSSENNESVVITLASLDSAGSTKQIDGYLLSKMLNIPCIGGEKIINTDSSVPGSLTSSSMSALNDVYRFEEAVHVPPKKNKKCGKVSTSNEKSEQEDGWVLNGKNVVEIYDLPGDCDVTLLQDIIAAYGAIIESDVISSGSTVSVRYQLDSSEAANWVISNLDNADYLFADHCVKCRRVT